ncbi:hypothetical protein ABIE45_006266 [Methylobacterium sp. OAE515]
MTDHLDGAIAELGLVGSLTGQNSPCRRLCIDGIGLALAATELPVDPTNFDDTQAHGSQGPREAGTVGAGSLDAEGMHHTVLGRPGGHLAIPRAGHRE